MCSQKETMHNTTEASKFGGNMLVDTADAVCPVCGQIFSAEMDLSGGWKQDIIEDCPNCCRSLLQHLSNDQGAQMEVAVERNG